MNDIIQYWRNKWNRAANHSKATDTSKLFRAPEVESHLNAGHYYKKDGTWLFTIDKSEDVYIYENATEPKVLSYEEITERYYPTDLQKNEQLRSIYLSSSYTNADFLKLPIPAIELLMLAGLAFKEEPNREGKYAVAFAVKNRWEKSKIENPKLTFTSTFNSLNRYIGYNSLHEKMIDIRKPYKTFFETSPIERNIIEKMRWGIGAAINAFIDNGVDYSNGATGWQGADIYFEVKGSTAKTDMENAGYKWVEHPLMGDDARFTPITYADKANPEGKYKYFITASYGNGTVDGVISGTIFTKPNL